MYRIIQFPEALKVLNPAYIIDYIQEFGFHSFFKALGSVMLAITGVEALYADLGHFSRKPIQASWLCFAFPSLVFQYIGQTAMLIQDKDTSDDPFFLTVPKAIQWPVVITATLASCIASQAIISGCFALIDQAISLGVFPRVLTIHTSRTERGQIYIPAINYFLMVCSIALVALFKSSEKLASIYGITVTGDMCITSFFFVMVMYLKWKTPTPYIITYIIVFWTLDILLFTSAIIKIPHGGWLSVLISFFLFQVMFVWYTIDRDMNTAFSKNAMELKELKELSRSMVRVKGVGIFVSSKEEDVPNPLIWIMTRANILPEKVIVLTIYASSYPFVPEKSKIIIRQVDASLGVFRVVAQYGFGEHKVRCMSLTHSQNPKNL
jgi:KUP system potassium uptake protein